MTNLTNQDNVGNYYFGYRDNNLPFDNAQVALNAPTLVNWINACFGDTYAVVSHGTNSFHLILPHPDEVLTPPATSVTPYWPDSKRRFAHDHINGRATGSSDSMVAYGIPNGGSRRIDLNSNPTLVYYAVLNNSSLNIFYCYYNSTGLLPNVFSVFTSIGFLKNPLYSPSRFVENAYFYSLGTEQMNGQNIWKNGGRRPEVLGVQAPGFKELRVPWASTSVTADPIANYAISCQTATPGANTTDLVLRDDEAPNKAIGSVSNLLKTTLNIPVGQIYRNTGVDPDGSNNPRWMCVGKMGSESILMRVWATGLV
jgi:hypothetical protein